MALRTLDGLAVRGKRVLLRADLNVPVRDGVITDLTRIERLLPTIRELRAAGARVAVCSHFDRPKGKPVPSMSIRPMAVALSEALGHPVAFAEDCVGGYAKQAIGHLRDGDVCVLENTRFHPGEEANDPDFASALAEFCDVYVNDAFSAAHRAHASTEGVAHILPGYADFRKGAGLVLPLTNQYQPEARAILPANGTIKLTSYRNLPPNL